MDKNNLHKHIRETGEEMPLDFSWEHMEEPILSGLEELDRKKRLRWSWLRWSPILLLLFLGVCQGLHSYHDGTDATKIPQKKRDAEVEGLAGGKGAGQASVAPIIKNQANSNLPNSNPLHKTGQKPRSDHQPNRGGLQGGAYPNMDSKTHSKSNVPQRPNHQIGNVKNHTTNPASEDRPPLPHQASEKAQNSEMSKAGTPKVFADSGQGYSRPQGFENPKPEQRIKTEKEGVRQGFKPIRRIPCTSVDPNMKNAPKVSGIKSKKGRHWRLGVYAGITNWTPNYKGGLLAPQKSLTEQQRLGYGLEIKVTYLLRGNWQVSSGIEYLNLKSRFNYMHTRDTLVEGEKTYIETNATTGNFMGSFSQVELLDALTWRRVVHYNRYRQYSIPISVSRSLDVGNKVFLEMGAGLKYTLSSKERGRMLKDMATYQPEYITDSDFEYRNSMGLLIEFGAYYKLHQNWSVGIASRYSWRTKDIYSNGNITSRPHVLFSKVGIQYSF